MSTDSLKKQSKGVVLPQAVNDPSLIESVAGFIHEVVPQAYSSVLPGESKDGILWARFETVDYNDPENYSPIAECESQTIPPILLVLGYSTGVQVWSIAGSGEATELFSWCQGAVKILQFLYHPQSRDHYSSKRPLVAIVDSGSQGIQFATLSLVSLREAEVVKTIKFNSPICEVLCNRRIVAVALNEKIAVFDLASFDERFTITTCYPSPGISRNPIALGTRWLAFANASLMPWERSSGGCEGDGAHSYTSTVIHAAKSIRKGILELGGTLTGSSQSSTHSSQTQALPGIVTIVDIEQKKAIGSQEAKIIAHFVAHMDALVAMTFDPSGILLVTADKNGHRFNVFRIHSHPCTSQLSAVHHLYILHRGDTTARVQDITVSWDSRWVAVLTERGTTHVFPITPYGGITAVRTHASFHVVNKLSSFEHSSGLTDKSSRVSRQTGESTPMQSSPRLPPYPHPYLVNSLAQLRNRPDVAPLAAWFAPPRAWIPGQSPQTKKTFADSLYVIFNSGSLLQYDLFPMAPPDLQKHQLCYSTKVHLKVDLKAEWVLPKPDSTHTVSYPLPLGHVLLDPPSRHQLPPDEWLSQVEIETHTGPHRRLWMGPQFSFMAIDGSSGEGGREIGPESGNPLLSSPDIMAHRPFPCVEISSGSPKLGYTDEAGGRLKDDLADAMLETHISTGQTKGKLRRAEVEWQVNPLGAVQTHPVIHSHWPHPICFELYSQEHKSLEIPTSQKIVKGLLEIQNMEEQSSEDTFFFDKKSLSVSDKPKASTEEVLPGSIEAIEPSCVSSQIPSCSTSVDTLLVKDFKNSSSCLIKTEDEHLVEEENELPLTDLMSLKEVASPENISSKNVLKSVELVSEPLHSDKVSSAQDIEEKAKPTGRKSKKKKNGNDKKIKKEQVKTILADECMVVSYSESQIVGSQSEGENLREIGKPLIEEIVQEDSICENKPVAIPDILDIIDELRDTTVVDQSLFNNPISVGEDSTLAELSDVAQELLLSHVSSDPILSFRNTDISEEEMSLSGGTTVSLLRETQQITKKNDSFSNMPCEFSGMSPDYFKEHLHIKDLKDCDTTESTTLESPVLLFDKDLLETDKAEVTESKSSNLSDKDLNGNNTLEEKNLESEMFDITLSTVESSAIVHEPPPRLISTSTPKDSDTDNTSPVEPDKEFTPVSSKSTRNKNRRRKKEKKQEQVSQYELNEIESSESVEIVKEECSLTKVKSVKATESIVSPESEIICALEVIAIESSEESPLDKKNDEVPQRIVPEEGISLESEVTDLQVLTNNSMKESLKSSSLNAASSLILSDEVQSDQVVSTDKSEIEDVSSHSGKESDDSKINKKERSRKQKRSESSEKDYSEFKKKSPSPATIKSDNKDSESSDEAGQLTDNKQPIPKAPKRKKGKKNEEIIPEIFPKGKSETKEYPASSKGSIEDVKYKSSESSLESSGESRISRHSFGRPWSHSINNSDPHYVVEDRDSVYESCNDDGASDSLAFESSKEDFDDSSSKNITTEPSSSNTEDKPDTNDKSIQPFKKVRKQKKKKR